MRPDKKQDRMGLVRSLLGEGRWPNPEETQLLQDREKLTSQDTVTVSVNPAIMFPGMYLTDTVYSFTKSLEQ